jgi:LETM1 and EF-hand domain-containing protein 1
MGVICTYPVRRPFHSSSLVQFTRSIPSHTSPVHKSTETKEPAAGKQEPPARPKDDHEILTEVSAPPEKKLTLWQKVKHEAQHYWQGTQLLGAEIKISARLLWKLLKRSELSRRELRQLKRTTADLLRLVPFLIIVLIPFLELLLPVLLKLFPNMLPSTFESKFQEEEKRKKLLKMRLEMAKFLQDTVEEVALTKKASGESSKAAKDFTEFFQKVSYFY